MEREKRAAPRLGSVQKKRWIIRITVLLAALLLAGTALYVYVYLPSRPLSVDPEFDMVEMRRAVNRLQEVTEGQQKETSYTSFLHKAIMEISIEKNSGKTIEDLLQSIAADFRFGDTVYSYAAHVPYEEGQTLAESYTGVHMYISDWTSTNLMTGGDLYEEYLEESGRPADPDAPGLRNAIMVRVLTKGGDYTFRIFSSGTGFLEELVAACVEEANTMIAEQAGE